MKYNKKIHNQIYGYATKVLGLRTYRRGWLKGNCPACGKADKFGMNLGLFRTNCFVCGYNPSPLKLVMEAEGLLNYYDTYKILGSYKDATYTEPVPKKILSVDIQLPDSYTNILFGDSIIAESARAYVKKRGFDINEVALKSWGYCTTGDYSGYLIIPFYMSGKLIYFNARKFMGMGSKYKNPDIEQSGMGKSMVMYNADALGIYHKIYLVEGVFNEIGRASCRERV